MPICIENDCTSHAYYGIHCGNPLVCAEHKKPEYVHVNYHKCIIVYCAKQPYDGCLDSAIAQYCNLHRHKEHVSFLRVIPYITDMKEITA